LGDGDNSNFEIKANKEELDLERLVKKIRDHIEKI